MAQAPSNVLHACVPILRHQRRGRQRRRRSHQFAANRRVPGNLRSNRTINQKFTAPALACPPVHTGFVASCRSHFGLTPIQRYSPMKPRCRWRTPSAEQDPTSRPQSNGHSRQRLCNRCLVAATHLTTTTTPTLTRASAPPIKRRRSSRRGARETKPTRRTAPIRG